MEEGFHDWLVSDGCAVGGVGLMEIFVRDAGGGFAELVALELLIADGEDALRSRGGDGATERQMGDAIRGDSGTGIGELGDGAAGCGDGFFREDKFAAIGRADAGLVAVAIVFAGEVPVRCQSPSGIWMRQLVESMAVRLRVK